MKLTLDRLKFFWASVLIGRSYGAQSIIQRDPDGQWSCRQIWPTDVVPEFKHIAFTHLAGNFTFPTEAQPNDPALQFLIGMDINAVQEYAECMGKLRAHIDEDWTEYLRLTRVYLTLVKRVQFK